MKIFKSIFNIIHYAILISAVLMATSCKDEDQPSQPYLYFDHDITSLSYTVNGGEQTIEMFSNQRNWVVQPAYADDSEWIDIWPNEGNYDGRFKITIAKNEGAYTRVSAVNVVISGKIVKSVRVSQLGVAPSIALDMGSNTMTASAKGATMSIPLLTNISWKALAQGEASQWISFGQATENTQQIIVAPNKGEERSGVVRFQALGTNYENLFAELIISQFNSAQDPYNGTKITVKEAIERYGNTGVAITDNVWVEADVISDLSKRNIDLGQLFVQDESQRGMMFEFASVKENVYKLNDKLKIHLLGQKFESDRQFGSLKIGSFSSNAVFEQTAGEGIRPIELDYIENLAAYENTLVTLRQVEFVQAYGTYFNADERYSEPIKSVTVTSNPASLPFCDGHDFYGHLLRDARGNTCKLYTLSWFTDRYVVNIPEGSGSVTGIVTKYAKEYGTNYIIRLRSNDDNKVSESRLTRLSTTLIQFGPFDDIATYSKITPKIGQGQFKTSMWEACAMGAGGISMDWGWSYARKTKAVVTVRPDGSQTVTPAISNSAQSYNIAPCVSCQYFWNCTASTMNREGAPEDYKGEAWVFNVDGFAPAPTGDMWLSFAAASSQTGPMYFDIEWNEDENAPISQWHKFGEYISPDWYTCTQLQQFILKLPEELRTKSKFTIRFRVSKNWRAGNGMTGGSWTEDTGIDKGGSPRIGYWAISQITQ